MLRRIASALGFKASGSVRIGYSSRAYEAGRHASRDMGNWQPSLASPDAEVLGNRDTITARSRDMDRNSGIM